MELEDSLQECPLALREASRIPSALAVRLSTGSSFLQAISCIDNKIKSCIRAEDER